MRELENFQFRVCLTPYAKLCQDFSDFTVAFFGNCWQLATVFFHILSVNLSCSSLDFGFCSMSWMLSNPVVNESPPLVSQHSITQMASLNNEANCSAMPYDILKHLLTFKVISSLSALSLGYVSSFCYVFPKSILTFQHRQGTRLLHGASDTQICSIAFL